LEVTIEIVKNTNNGEKRMAKPKRPKPTNKDFEIALVNIMKRLNALEYKFNAFDNLFGLYLEWKKETKKFHNYVQVKAKRNIEKSKSEK
jgi:hypothetical protein|tara:strand:- start:1664 stop:1930 length:267 start_codon:yes stop_codon:yes gene_type:complete